MNEAPRTTSTYFSVDSLVYAQIPYLSGQEVVKEVHLNGEVEQETMRLDSGDWSNELKLFIESSINTPANTGAYLLEQQLEDPESNLLFDRWTAEPDHVGSVRYIEVYYYETPEQIKKVKVRQEEENELYRSAKDLFMSFTTRNQKPVLSEYRIQGFQQLITRDSTVFLISGKVAR